MCCTSPCTWIRFHSYFRCVRFDSILPAWQRLSFELFLIHCFALRFIQFVPFLPQTQTFTIQFKCRVMPSRSVSCPNFVVEGDCSWCSLHRYFPVPATVDSVAWPFIVWALSSECVYVCRIAKKEIHVPSSSSSNRLSAILISTRNERRWTSSTNRAMPCCEVNVWKVNIDIGNEDSWFWLGHTSFRFVFHHRLATHSFSCALAQSIFVFVESFRSIEILLWNYHLSKCPTLLSLWLESWVCVVFLEF